MHGVMNLFRTDRPNQQRRPTWRDYQDQLQRRPSRRSIRRRAVLFLSAGALLVFCVYMSLPSTGDTSTGQHPEPVRATAPPPAELAKPAPTPTISKATTPEKQIELPTPAVAPPSPAAISSSSAAQAPSPVAVSPTPFIAPLPRKGDRILAKKDAQLLLAGLDLGHLMDKSVTLPTQGQALQVQTHLAPDLQALLIDAMDRKNSRFIGIVVMEADTGKIRALAGFDKSDPRANPCLQSTFPAASLFKIVTAAAAVDHYGYTSNTPISYNGYKHTLYKSQLKELSNKYTYTISFADSFAQSVNPVFGKLGSLRLGKDLLEAYGLGFGFNQPLDFELEVAPSHLVVTDAPYRLAEIASGFNNETTMSPLHAAVMVSAVLNQGRLVAPSLVDRIVDDGGKVLYQSHPTWQRRAMTSRASSVLAQMMEETVQSGTARKAFRGQQRDPVLARLRIGGKTGSISNATNDARYDWFVGFAESKEGSGQLAVAVMVAHEEYIGVRAGTYARMAMAHYFKQQLPPALDPSRPKNRR
jgi:hypothetical protein